MIARAGNIALIGDYKTGKYKDYSPPNGYGQLELSSAIALSIFDVEEVKTIYLYVDHKKSIQKHYTKDDKNRLVDHFTAEHVKVNSEKNFDPTSNEFCTYCESTKSQCKYSRKL